MVGRGRRESSGVVNEDPDQNDPPEEHRGEIEFVRKKDRQASKQGMSVNVMVDTGR